MTNRARPTRTWTRVLVATLVAAACGSDATSVPGGGPITPNTLVLPVRVHILSSRIAALEAGSDDAAVGALLGRVNEVWAQADIRWSLESVIREAAGAEDQLELALGGAIPLTGDVLASVLPRDSLTGGAWDVFLVRDLSAVAGFPGVFFPSIPGVIASEVDPAGLDDPGRILAHELGHSLTLQHVACTPAGNLMAPGCASSNRTRLDPDQILAARAQARTGRSAGG